MNYQELSPQGETLLKEIIDLQASGQDNAAYWSKRFDGLSMQQDTLLRDTFRELRECGYVHIQWADNIPYYPRKVCSYLHVPHQHHPIR